MRILIVEDNRKLSDLIKYALIKASFDVDQAFTGAEALSALAFSAHDAAILDLGLPDEDGLEVLKKIRAGKNMIPILILTAREKLDDKINGLNQGADDYLVKPFEIKELIARLRALLRRPGTAVEPQIVIGNLTYDTLVRQAMIDGQNLHISKREADVLEQLARSEGRVVTKEKLEKNLYSYGETGSANSVEVIVHRLRKKLANGNAKLQIHTLRGVGYIMAEQASDGQR